MEALPMYIGSEDIGLEEKVTLYGLLHEQYLDK